MSDPTLLECPVNPDPAPRPAANRRRGKKQLSCNFCRQRKCRPCAACTARGRACVFPGVPAQQQSPQPAASKLNLTNLEDRVRYLEGLIHSTVTAVPHKGVDNEANSSLAGGSSSSPSPSGCVVESGTMQMGAKGTVYVGSPHWAAIVDGISELKDPFGRVDDSQVPSDAGVEPTGPPPHGPLLLYSSTRPMTKGQLLRALPLRPAVDRLIFHYFNKIAVPPMRVIHPGTFIQQYEVFWDSPSTVSIHWLGLLFSVMGLSTVFISRLEQPPCHSYFGTKHSPLQPSYVAEMAQCLIGGDYIRGGPHVIETLIHYCMIELFRLPDSEVGGWMVSSMATQVALRMGYHRDPSHFPDISPFDGEMRRRVWAMVYLCDSTFSVLVGTPRIITEGCWDTKSPLNIQDADLDRYCTQLPTPRPDAEMTTMSFSLARYKLNICLGWLIDASISNSLRTHVELKCAEIRLDTMWNSISDRFKFRSLTNCLSDTPSAIVQRLVTTCLYNKLLIMLHRCNLLGSPSDSSSPPLDGGAREYEVYSRRTCVGAALHNVQCLILLEAETRPDGSLAVLRSNMSALVIHEFLVATAVLGRYLYKFGASAAGDGWADSIDALELESTLRQSKEPWVQLSSWSEAARRAVKMLDLLFQKLEGKSANAPPREFSMVLDGMGLNYSRDKCF